jgi:hypothetical protein
MIFQISGLNYPDLLVVGEPADGAELALIGYREDTLFVARDVPRDDWWRILCQYI